MGEIKIDKWNFFWRNKFRRKFSIIGGFWVTVIFLFTKILPWIFPTFWTGGVGWIVVTLAIIGTHYMMAELDISIGWVERTGKYLRKQIRASSTISEEILFYREEKIKNGAVVYEWSIALSDIMLVIASRRDENSYVSFFDKNGVDYHINMNLKPKGWDRVDGSLRYKFGINDHWWFVVEGEGKVLYPLLRKRQRPYQSTYSSRNAFRNRWLHRIGLIHPAHYMLRKEVLEEAMIYLIGKSETA